MFTEYTIEESEMQGNYPHPSISENEDSKADETIVDNSSNNEIIAIVSGANNFDNTRQFEFDMDGEKSVVAIASFQKLPGQTIKAFCNYRSKAGIVNQMNYTPCINKYN